MVEKGNLNNHSLKCIIKGLSIDEASDFKLRRRQS